MKKLLSALRSTVARWLGLVEPTKAFRPDSFEIHDWNKRVWADMSEDQRATIVLSQSEGPRLSAPFIGGDMGNGFALKHHAVSPEGRVRFFDERVDGYEYIDTDWMGQ